MPSTIYTRFELFGPRGGDGLQLPASQTAYAFPTALTASTMLFNASVISAGVVSKAGVRVVWTPNATGCGIRVSDFDGGPFNLNTLAEFTNLTAVNPIVSDADITSRLVSLLSSRTPKFLGFQFRGDGAAGPVLYAVWIDIYYTI